MANIKLKDKNGVVRNYTGVNVIKLKDENDNDVAYTASLYQKTVFMATDTILYSSQENNSGVATTIPEPPTRSGYIFRGWSEVDNQYVQANKVVLPKVYNADQFLYAMWVETPSGADTVSGLGEQYPSTISYVTDAGFDAVIADIIAGNYDETDVNNNVFVKFPTVYRKILTSEDGQITSIALSFTQIDSDYKPYSCFVKPDGVTVMPYIYIGKYPFTSTSQASSVSGSAVSTTFSVARPLARAVGTGYQLYDWQMQRLLQDLSVAYYKTINPTGNILGLQGMTNWHWIDGFARNNTQWLFAYNPADYVDSPSWTDIYTHTAGYNIASYSSPSASGRIKKLGYDTSNPFFNYPNVVGGSSGEYYVTNFDYSGGNHPVRSSLSVGVWYCYSNYDWNNAYGVRLCYRPIA